MPRVFVCLLSQRDERLVETVGPLRPLWFEIQTWVFLWIRLGLDSSRQEATRNKERSPGSGIWNERVEDFFVACPERNFVALINCLQWLPSASRMVSDTRETTLVDFDLTNMTSASSRTEFCHRHESQILSIAVAYFIFSVIMMSLVVFSPGESGRELPSFTQENLVLMVNRDDGMTGWQGND